jgi:hypothetical protein
MPQYVKIGRMRDIFCGSYIRTLSSPSLYRHTCFTVDLTNIDSRLRTVLHCTPRDAARTVDEYRRFLYLLSIRGDESMLMPSKRVEEAWQCHILHSKLYRTHCDLISGRFIHYSPISSNDSISNRRILYQETLKLYRDVFNEEPDDHIWPASYHSILESMKLNYRRTMPNLDFARKYLLSPDIGDMETICLRLVNVHNWGTTVSENRVSEYLKYLELVNQGSNRMQLVPSKLIDTVWHEHMLHTRLYEFHCMNWFGKVVDHNPASDLASAVEYSIAYNYTLHRYKEVFGTAPPVKHWPRQAIERQTQDDDGLVYYLNHHYLYNTSHRPASNATDTVTNNTTIADTQPSTGASSQEISHYQSTLTSSCDLHSTNGFTRAAGGEFQASTFAKDEMFFEEEFQVTEFKDDSNSSSFFSSDDSGGDGGGDCGGGGCGGD